MKLLLQLHHPFNCFLEWCRLVNAVTIIEIDVVDSELLKALLASLLDIVWIRSNIKKI